MAPGKGATIDGSYELKPVAATPDEREGIAFAPAGPNLSITIGHEPFSVYRVDEGAKPFLFPLIGPTRAPVTRSFPMKKVSGEDFDHPHQRSFWFTHGRVNGVDFWSEQERHGNIKETSRPTVLSGPVVGRLRTTDDWIDPDGRKVCSDERVLTIYRTTGSRILDFDIELKATEGPVTFGDTKEGMFGLRVASSMDVNKKLGGKDHECRGTDRRPGLGQGISLGRLHRTRRGQDRRDRDPQPPAELPLSHDLARPDLRPVRRQPLRLEGFRPGPQRRVHAPGGRVATIRLSRDPARG